MENDKIPDYEREKVAEAILKLNQPHQKHTFFDKVFKLTVFPKSNITATDFTLLQPILITHAQQRNIWKDIILEGIASNAVTRVLTLSEAKNLLRSNDATSNKKSKSSTSSESKNKKKPKSK